MLKLVEGARPSSVDVNTVRWLHRYSPEWVGGEVEVLPGIWEPVYAVGDVLYDGRDVAYALPVPTPNKPPQKTKREVGIVPETPDVEYLSISGMQELRDGSGLSDAAWRRVIAKFLVVLLESVASRDKARCCRRVIAAWKKNTDSSSPVWEELEEEVQDLVPLFPLQKDVNGVLRATMAAASLGGYMGTDWARKINRIIIHVDDVHESDAHGRYFHSGANAWGQHTLRERDMLAIHQEWVEDLFGFIKNP